MFRGPLTEEEKCELGDRLYDEMVDRKMDERIYREDNEAWLVVLDWEEADELNEEVAEEAKGERIWDQMVTAWGEATARSVSRNAHLRAEYRLMFPEVFE